MTAQIETIIAKAVRPAYSDFPPSIDAVSVAVLAALDAAGFVVVPKEPTDAMLKAGYNAMFVDEWNDKWNGTQALTMAVGYDAMIEARPK